MPTEQLLREKGLGKEGEEGPDPSAWKRELAGRVAVALGVFGRVTFLQGP